jgi:hypothetical protein
MANLVNTIINGRLGLPTLSQSGSANNLWFSDNRLNYSYTGNVFATSGALITARNLLAGIGTQGDSLAIGGNFPQVSCVEKYNGSTWSSATGLITARTALAGSGISSAALAFGGCIQPALPAAACVVTCTEAYNGTSWSSCAGLITARRFLSGTGTSNATLAAGGVIVSPSTTALNNTERFNGTTWSAGSNTPQRFATSAFAGTQNAALLFGGCTTSVDTFLASAYNGSSWSEVAGINRTRSCAAGAGTSTAALYFGGSINASIVATCTENYNGGVWFTGGALIQGRFNLAGSGTSTTALAFGGSTPTVLSCTEKATQGIVVCTFSVPISGSVIAPPYPY